MTFVTDSRLSALDSPLSTSDSPLSWHRLSVPFWAVCGSAALLFFINCLGEQSVNHAPLNGFEAQRFPWDTDFNGPSFGSLLSVVHLAVRLSMARAM